MIQATGLRARARLLKALRAWFDAHAYLEVPTATLVPSPAMEEHLLALGVGGGFLRTSPEFALKRVISSGLPRVYEIGPCFRVDERSPWHEREFTMLEWYRAGAELEDLMDEVEELVASCAHALDLPPPAPFRRVTVRELVLERTGLDLATATAMELSGVEESWDDAFLRLWVSRVEPHLSGGLFVSEWPASHAALARVRTDQAWPVACRFEAYLGGVELANAFLELTDSAEQRARVAQSNAARVQAGRPPHPVDEAFVEAVGRMPRTAGIALGVDRLVAVLCGWSSIGPGRVAAGFPPT